MFVSLSRIYILIYDEKKMTYDIAEGFYHESEPNPYQTNQNKYTVAFPFHHRKLLLQKYRTLTSLSQLTANFLAILMIL